MEWFYFVLLSALLFGITIIVDKFFLGKVTKKPLAYTMFLGLLLSSFAFLLLVLRTVSFVSPYSFIGLIPGLLWIISVYFYSKSTIKEEISRVSSLLFTSPIFVAILSFIFLREVLVLHQYLGIVLLISSAILISYQKIKGKISMINSLKFIFISAFLIAVENIINKHILFGISYLSVYFWNSFGTLIGILFLLTFTKVRREFIDLVKTFRHKKLLPIFAVSEPMAFFAYISFNFALSLGKVSLVSAIGPVQAFFVFLFTLFLSIFRPRILKEEINKSTILIKLLAILLLFVGTWLVVG
jgi:drug/metabolite transporter (DMT)-like permease